MRQLVAVLSLLAIAMASGCGSDDEPPAPAPSGDEPLVTWERGGGIAGIAERLEIEADGDAVLTVGIDERRRSFELTGAELERLRAALDAAELEAVEAPPENAICADCFSYEITTPGRSAAWDDSVELPGSVGELSAALAELAADHYPPGTERIEGLA